MFVLEHPDVIGNVLSLSGAFCRGAAGSSEGFAYPTFTRTLFAALHRMRGLREHAYAVDVVVDGESAIVQAAVNGYDAKQRADHERTTAAVSCGLRRMQC